MIKKVLQIVPKPIRKVIFDLFRKTFFPYWKSVSAGIPKYELDDKHIANARLLKNRKQLLKILPKNAVVAELGVDKGDFSELILKICEPKKLHLIDYWGTKQYNQKKRKEVEHKFSDHIKAKTVEIDLGLSTEVASNFKDNYFDWIYIDTDHTYKTTFAELEIYKDKLKKGGIIAGHDYITGHWDGMVRYGVIEAVHQFCYQYNWEIIYITVEQDQYPSFAIREGSKT